MYVIISVLLPVWGKSDKEGKVGGPFLSLASHSVCRRERLSIMEVEKGTHILHLPKSKMYKKPRTKWLTEISVSSLQLKYYQCSQIWPYLQNLHKPISWSIMNIKIHPCRCPQWQYSGEWGMKRLKRWRVAATSALCKQLIYVHILCIREAITYQLCSFFKHCLNGLWPLPPRFKHVCCKFFWTTKVRKRLSRQNLTK